MAVRLTRHAAEKLEERGLTRDDLEFIIDNAERTVVTDSAVRYDANLRGLTHHVIVVKNSDPPIVITAYEVIR